MNLTFKNVNLAKYPQETLPWFKGMSGNMSGWVKKEVPWERSDKQKGAFRITMTAGELKGLHIKGLQNFVLGYREVTAEGRISGSKVYVDKALVEGDGIKLKGSGTIERGEPDQRVNLIFTCENSSNASPLANGSLITVTGDQWSPTITISTEPAQQGEKITLQNQKVMLEAGRTL